MSKMDTRMTFSKKSIYIFFAFSCLVFSDSKFVNKYNITMIFEFFSILVLIIGCLYSYLKRTKSIIKINKEDILILLLFTIGIMLQNMLFFTKLRLLLTMIAIFIFIRKSNFLLNGYKEIKYASYGALFGIFLSIIAAILFNISLFDKVYDSSMLIINVGFDGGILFKNYFSSILLASFVGISLDYVYGEKKILDLFLLIIILILDFLSSSRGGLALLFLYIIFLFLSKIKIKRKLSKSMKIIRNIVVVVFLLISFSVLINKVLINSSTYSYRIRGVQNYLDYVHGDYFHILFGNSAMAFQNSNLDYVQNIRKTLEMNGFNGYSGTYEMGFINVFIKNGLLGLLGFLLCYIKMIKNISKEKSTYYTSFKILFIIFIISSLVENYVCNLHTFFCIFTYIVLNTLIEANKEK